MLSGLSKEECIEEMFQRKESGLYFNVSTMAESLSTSFSASLGGVLSPPPLKMIAQHGIRTLFDNPITLYVINFRAAQPGGMQLVKKAERVVHV